MQTLIPLIISSFVAALVSAIVASVYTRAKTATQRQIEKQEAFQKGMRALLWGELKRVHADGKVENGLTTEDRHHLEEVYMAYHSLGGNGTGTHLHDEAMNFPVKTD